jgi:hypothetical protein
MPPAESSHTTSSASAILRWLMALALAGLLAPALLLTAGCSRSPRLELHNRSAATLANLVVSGSGFAEPLGDLPPGGDLSATLRPTADTALRFAFDVDGKRVETAPIGYVEPEGGYRIRLEVTPAFEVRIFDSGGSAPQQASPGTKNAQ